MNAFEVIKTVRLTEKGTRQGEKYNQYTVVADRRANRPCRNCSRSRLPRSTR
jgi:ribosomal protein L23